MPIYCYRAEDPAHSCEHCIETFEVVQKMSDAPLGECPLCRAKVERIITSFYSFTNKTKDLLSDKSLSRMGFSKFVKEEKGKYRKVT
ncbi:MAG: zinc ribbon domain-containing protein [Candidatus Eremiobacteraeota bacterium]|nr:zinc ribbon domain-containing protein [Candidatus Eremiobacteraeota bacterium]